MSVPVELLRCPITGQTVRRAEENVIRDLQQIGRHQRNKWFHVERILNAAKLAAECERWRSIHSLWLPLSPRRKETLLGAERSR